MLTLETISATPRRLGRKKINDERLPARLPKGTTARMRDVLRPRGMLPAEKLSDLIRIAIEKEIRYREKLAAKRKDR